MTLLLTLILFACQSESDSANESNSAKTQVDYLAYSLTYGNCNEPEAACFTFEIIYPVFSNKNAEPLPTGSKLAKIVFD